jgi:hypothetical protein
MFLFTLNIYAYPLPRPGFEGHIYTPPVKAFYSYVNKFYKSCTSRSRLGLETGRAGLSKRNP